MISEAAETSFFDHFRMFMLVSVSIWDAEIVGVEVIRFFEFYTVYARDARKLKKPHLVHQMRFEHNKANTRRVGENVSKKRGQQKRGNKPFLTPRHTRSRHTTHKGVTYNSKKKKLQV